MIHSRDKVFENGIYVVAVSRSSNYEPLPQSSRLIRDYLHARGFKMVDSEKDASLRLTFDVADLSIEQPGAVPVGNEKSLSENASSLATQGAYAAAGQVVAKSAGTVSGLIVYGAGTQGHYNGAELRLSSSLAATTKGESEGIKLSDLPSASWGVTARTAQKDTDPKTNKGDLLLLMTKVWVDKYFVNDDK